MYAVQIEVVGTCNLRCPSCAVGNAEGGRRSGSIGGTMPLNRLRQTLDWVDGWIERDPAEVMVCLYSWGEPFIHTALPDLIAEVKRRGYVAGISSNLNHVRNLDAVLQAGVDEIVVSLSGFSQPIYEEGHAGGDIETVKRNMAALSEAIDRTGSAARVLVHYITYRHNAGADEFSAMAAYCEELRFEFVPSLAFFAPVEKLVEMASGRVFPNDAPILSRLVVPVEEQLRIAAAAPAGGSCSLIEERIDIDVDGALKLCCSSYDRQFNVAPAFDGLAVEEVNQHRRESALCESCGSRGIDRIFTRADYAEWCARANPVFEALEVPVRCVGPHLIAHDRPTESMLLALVNDALIGGRLAEAKASFSELERRLESKYGPRGTSIESVADYVRGGGRKFGREIPIDPLGLFCAAGLVAHMHDGDTPRARVIFETLRDMADRLVGAGIYGRTARAMQPQIAQSCAALAEPPPAEAASPGNASAPAPSPSFLRRAARRLRAALTS
ncbi:radical SAM protein [Azospirillum baldaniorum]|uniref:Radical SAM core domain-containing protein n=1 Tax=Azospirillum baldaniorum TaxID=1064539 RepID=A0A9P1JRE3_9PROT|nr:radical SAM protein [Azospirillum baldaniorum]AWJ89533.1 radical SAM protein [Azospirillum baldaniorum]CCC98298.1 protein of unknown function [Azospirillum baldaniorum]